MSKYGAMAETKTTEKPVFTLVHARYHGAWCWTYVQQLLAEQGYDSIAPNLPVEEISLNLNDHAEIVRQAESEKGADNYVDVGWSWGGDLIYRKLGSTPVSSLIFVAAPLRPLTSDLHLRKNSPITNSRTLLYHTWLKAEESGACDFDPVLIGESFYNDLEDRMLKALAIGALRPHPHMSEESDAVLPDIKMSYIGLDKDHALRYETQAEIATQLGIDFYRLPTDHAPMLSRPKVLADYLIYLATKNGDRVAAHI